jgi:hypothetical protein
MHEEPEGDAEVSAAERRQKARRAETIAVVLISLGGVATSWSTYQAALWGGEESAQDVVAIGLHMESARLSIEAGQQQTVDVGAFMQIVAAYGGGRDEEAEFVRARLRAEFRPAFEAWLASRPRENAAAPPTPFALPEYRMELREQAARRQAEAQQRFVAGQQANEVSDQYTLMAVVLATVMFLSGICQPLQVHRLKIGLIVLAAVLMAFGLYNLAVLPKAAIGTAS